MSDELDQGRRALLLGTAAAGTGLLPFVRPANAAAPLSDIVLLEERVIAAARRCKAAQAAFDDAVAAHEATLPQPLPALIVTDCRALSAASERRFFDNTVVLRGEQHGHPSIRRLVTVATANADLRSTRSGDGRWRKYLRNLRRRAWQYEDTIRRAEAAHRLEELMDARSEAQRDIHETTKALFEAPALALTAVHAQARALCLFSDCISEQWASFQTGRWGQKLAANMLQIGAAV